MATDTATASDRAASNGGVTYGRPESELRGYAEVMGVYLVGMTGTAAVLARTGRLPDRFSAGDLALVAAATHKLSRTLSKDVVTSPLRAPFTKFKGSAGPGEVDEKVVGTGTRKAVGELVTCPFCLDHWVASGFVAGLAFAPRLTRFVASILAVRAGADLLQFGYVAAEQATD